MIGLTAQQAYALRFIKSSFAERGFPPTYAELSEKVGLGKSSVHRLLHGLQDRGVISIKKASTRGINLIEDGVRVPLSPELLLAATKAAADQKISVETFVAEAVRYYVGLA